MLVTEVRRTFIGFILYISASVKGLLGQTNTICALQGSSVELHCSAENLTSNMKWYTVSWDEYEVIQTELSPDGNRVTYHKSEERYFTVTINDLGKSDENIYCCRENTDTPENCWSSGTKLNVADLQVKVIPTTEEQTVSLMCSTSCPLTENPAAYIWYKNGEFLYQDWSPWYQQLVSSEEAVTYSCAIKGYEHLRAPEVSVDSVTSTCFTVTYAKGRMCSKQTSVDEPCSITYPKKVYVQKKRERGHVTLTCNTSCPLTDPQTAYRWYRNKHIYRYSVGQHLLVSSPTDGSSFSCAVKGLEDVHSDEVCAENKTCWSVNYVQRRICALEDSSVNISSEYSYPDNQQPKSKSWYKLKRTGREDAEELTEDATGRVVYQENQNQHILRIKNLKKNDSAQYTLRLQTDTGCKQSHFTPVTLIVTDLRVKFTPSAEVTEGQRVTLTCSTSCPLTDDTNYLWYMNSRPLTLPENQTKHLVLDPVSSQHAGKYSCAVKTHSISSSEETLSVKVIQISQLSLGKSVEITNAVRLTVVLLITCLFCLWLRKKTLISPTESNTVQTEQYINVSFKVMNPVTAAQREPAEQQEDTVQDLFGF
ncbi:uncharacterized protein LOC108887183 isoform X2 [Lates calcarifer]|uniref:Uncharacterized protein LOC108887183 isoform X2 n=1 Tax=Lates calcarifer TaxID=8187 RepID=A0AAJ8B5M1_LATCA|nr:uncharacterized protein LOC108887183 isoform X2 [Lates calcarifer]